jgi:hypothetical protein
MCIDQMYIRCKYRIIILTSVTEEEAANIVFLRLAEGWRDTEDKINIAM